ncbi:MAG: TonB-dependent receptor [Ginsengibacter sp.]
MLRKLTTKLASLLVLFFLLIQTGFAQTKTISGKVTDANGVGVAGVTVSVKGSKVSTQTDNNGLYKINAAPNATLMFSSIGYGSKSIALSGKDAMDVSLVTQASNLTDVVVVGYGTRKIKDATGSVAAITPKDFNKGVISTPEQLFQGRTPGVVVTPSSGEPGAASTINIRGTSSIRGNNDPLYVVDGVPLDGGGTSGSNSGIEGSTTPKNPLLFLNPNDIESISILKDASSAAIYGSRGANGVIIITTKGGKGKKGSLSFSANTSISKTAKRYDLLNASDFLAAVKKANIDAGTSPADAAAAVLLVDKGASTDWQDQIFRTGVSQNYNLGWGFANNGTALRVSGSYDDQEGIIRNSGLKRLTGRLNFSQKFLNDKLKFEGTFTAANVKNQYAPNTNDAGYQGSLVGAAITFNPTFPVYDKDGSFYDPGDGNRNPAELLAYFTDNDNINRYLTNISGSYELIKGLTYKATFGYDRSKSLRKSFADPRLSSAVAGGTTNVFGVDYGNGINGNGRAVYQYNNLKTTLVEHTLTYNKLFGTSEINVVGGYSFQRTENDGSAKVGYGLTTPVVKPTDIFVKDINNFKTQKVAYIPFYSRTDLQSYFGRINYTLNDKYLLTATVRIDGSSKFGTNNKYGTFPAFAAKWRLLKEQFTNNNLGKWFSDFSVRANYGILGSQDGLGTYDAIDLQQKYLGNSGNVETAFLHQGNKDLKWEQAATTGVGLDWSTRDRRLSGTFDYYYTKRKNVLFYGPVPGGFSATSYYFSNLPGLVINKGLEFSFNYAVLQKHKFTWDISYNMTFLKNYIQDFNVVVNTGAVNGQGLSGAYAQTFANGYPLFTFKMPVFQGFDGNGDARYEKGAQDQLLGSALPKFIAGLTNSFSYGRWNASFFLNSSRGNYVYNNTANALFLKGSIKTAHNITYDVANSNEDPINPGSVSSRFLEKGDFIRLSNAVVSYNFKTRGKVIKSLTASVSGQNLFIITDYSGLDPEINVDHSINGVPSRGFDYAGYPKARTITFGINAGF